MRITRVLARFIVAAAIAVMARSAHAQDAAASDSLERRPYVLLAGLIGLQSPPSAWSHESHGGLAIGLGLAYPIRSRLLVRGEYTRQWYLRGAEAIASCQSATSCSPTRYASDFHAGAVLLERQTRGAGESRFHALGVLGAGLAWSAEDAITNADRTTPVGVLGAGFAFRDVLRSERGLRVEARYTIFARDALGTRGLASLIFGLSM